MHALMSDCFVSDAQFLNFFVLHARILLPISVISLSLLLLGFALSYFAYNKIRWFKNKLGELLIPHASVHEQGNKTS